MSPRKVNKDEKRREIALKCSDLIHEVGMKKLTVAEVAKTADIGKGTIYEYFENKEDIIFEIINIHIEKHNKELLLRKLIIRKKNHSVVIGLNNNSRELISKLIAKKENIKIYDNDNTNKYFFML